MKRIDEPIQVRGNGKRIETLIWRGRRVAVQAQTNAWIVRSRWWGAEEKRVYRMLQTDRGAAEVYQVGELWRMSRLAD